MYRKTDMSTPAPPPPPPPKKNLLSLTYVAPPLRTFPFVMFWGEPCDEFYLTIMHASSVGAVLLHGRDVEDLMSRWPSLLAELCARAGLPGDAMLEDRGAGWLGHKFGLLFRCEGRDYCLATDGMVYFPTLSCVPRA